MRTTKEVGTTRKAIPNKKRFEVFKRDSFTCQYCGAKSPDVTLNVDHIIPVASGGTNAMHNLTTSCFECNSGKGRVELSDESIAKQQRVGLEEQQERINQIKMMAKWSIEAIEILSEEVDAVADLISTLCEYEINDSGRKGVHKLISKYGLDSVMKSTIEAFPLHSIDSSLAFNKAFDSIKFIVKDINKPQHVREFIKYCNFSKKDSVGNDIALRDDIIAKHSDLLDGVDFKELHEYWMPCRDYLERIMEEIGVSYAEEK